MVKKWLPIFLGVLVFSSLVFVGLSLDGEARCNDGWHSPSIGRMGACSWHGGVRHGFGFPIVVLSGFAGLYAWGYSAEKFDKWGKKK